MFSTMTHLKPRICCLDLDTFFVSVERLLDPSLEGKPVVVGGRPGQRGVVTAASYEVRELGVKSGMALTQAAKLAPDAIFLPTRHKTYSTYSRRVKEVLEQNCPRIQTASIDEFYLDFTGCERMYQKPGDKTDDDTIHRTVTGLTDLIQDEVGLPSSAGIGTCKPVSKIACGLAKPRGVMLVPAGTEAEFLAPLGVRKLPGIGPVGEQKLQRLGILTLGQLARLPVEILEGIFGKWARVLLSGARGQGALELSRDRPAFLEHDPVGGTVGSISNERTFREDVSDPASIQSMLCSLCERVCWRARKRGVKARTVTLKLRYTDFNTITRSRTVAPTNSEIEVFPVVQDLYQIGRTRRLPIRLLGLAFSNLDFFDGQLRLFDNDEQLCTAVDAIREKYGYDAVRIAVSQGKR
jgi:DNA polymerase-4